MKLEVVLLYEYDKAFFYSIEKLNDDLTPIDINEFLDFQTRMNFNSKDVRQKKELERMIRIIGEDSGATFESFKRENEFERLPYKGYEFYDSNGIDDYGLRLYCIRINEECVILLNGDRKTTSSAQDCPNCGQHFEFAEKVAKAFYTAKYLRKISVYRKEIVFEDEDFYLEV